MRMHPRIRPAHAGILTLIALLLAFCGSALAQNATMTFNLEGAVLKALEANPRIEGAEFGVSAAEMGIKSAQGAFYPSLSTEYSYTHYDREKPSSGQDDDRFTWALSVHQDIFTGWRMLSTEQKAKLNKEYAEYGLNLTELALVLNVQENFFALLKAREMVLSAEASLKRLESQLKVTKAFYDVGLKPRLDVLEAEVDLADAEDTLLQAKNAVETQIVRLNTLLDLPIDANVMYEGELRFAPCSLQLGALLQKAYAQRPDIKMAVKSVEIAEQDATIAKSGLYPQVGADLTWYTVGDDPAVHGDKYLGSSDYSAWEVELSAQWKVFDWGQTWYQWKQAQEAARKIEAEARNTKLEATNEVTSRHLKIAEAAERIRVARKAVEQAQESYRMAQARYQAQVGTNTDVLLAQAGLTSAEANLTEALADHQIALARLFYSIGEKNPALAVQ